MASARMIAFHLYFDTIGFYYCIHDLATVRTPTLGNHFHNRQFYFFVRLLLFRFWYMADNEAHPYKQTQSQTHSQYIPS